VPNVADGNRKKNQQSDSNSEEPLSGLKFEEAFQKLEDIIKRLDEGNLTLEDSLKAFEEGVRLSRHCSRKLDEAEKRVEILLKESGGRLTPQPFSLEEE
jgi:exodeoxyribonuclease VII small subunit